METITVRLVGDAAVRRQLDDLARKALAGPGMNRMLRGIGAIAVRSVQRGIRQQKSPDGRAYKRLERYGQSGQRLRDTSRLINSLTFHISGPSRVTVGTNLIYARTQHFGDPNRRAKSGKMLAIPTTRQIARAVAGRGFRAAFPDAFVIQLGGTRFGNERVFLVRRLDKGAKGAGESHRISKRHAKEGVRSSKSAAFTGGRLEFLAALVPRVSIPGTGFLGLSQDGRAEVLSYIDSTIRRAVGAK